MTRMSGLGLLALTVVGVAEADTYHVPGDASTILAGLDLASAGDSVVVGPGTWSDVEDRVIVILGIPYTVSVAGVLRGGVTLLGEAGPDATIITGTSDRPGSFQLIAFHNQAGLGSASIEGFTFTGVVDGLAIVGTVGDGLEVRSCRFVGNVGFGAAASAVQATSCPATFLDCEFVGNQSAYAAVGAQDAAVTATRCRFEANVGGCIRGTGIGIPRIVRVEDSEFIANRGDGLGICVDANDGMFMSVTGSLFERNVVETGPGGAIRGGEANCTVEFCSFVRDSVVAGDLSMEHSLATIRNNTFVGCRSMSEGAAVVMVNSTVWFENNVVAYSSGGSAVANVQSDIRSSSCNDFWANQDGDFFGGWTPGPSDFFEDPLFCDWEDGDLTLQAGSPCAPDSSCGAVGAFGVACDTISRDPVNWGRIKTWFRLE